MFNFADVEVLLYNTEFIRRVKFSLLYRSEDHSVQNLTRVLSQGHAYIETKIERTNTSIFLYKVLEDTDVSHPSRTIAS